MGRRGYPPEFRRKVLDLLDAVLWQLLALGQCQQHRGCHGGHRGGGRRQDLPASGALRRLDRRQSRPRPALGRHPARSHRRARPSGRRRQPRPRRQGGADGRRDRQQPPGPLVGTVHLDYRARPRRLLRHGDPTKKVAALPLPTPQVRALAAAQVRTVKNVVDRIETFHELKGRRRRTPPIRPRPP